MITLHLVQNGQVKREWIVPKVHSYSDWPEFERLCDQLKVGQRLMEMPSGRVLCAAGL